MDGWMDCLSCISCRFFSSAYIITRCLLEVVVPTIEHIVNIFGHGCLTLNIPFTMLVIILIGREKGGYHFWHCWEKHELWLSVSPPSVSIRQLVKDGHRIMGQACLITLTSIPPLFKSTKVRVKEYWE
jgi:hypothetical protein